MLKKNFVTLVLSTIGGILFAMGMCMCMLPEWNAFSQGIAVGAAGVLILLIMMMVRRKMEGKPVIVRPSGKVVGIVIVSVAGALLLGVSMCMVTVFQGMMIQGIAIGLVGITALLTLIPCAGDSDRR